MSYKAMIVEDNAIYRYAVKTIIDWPANGFDLAAEAINGKQALQYMETERFDLILTDVSMPEMDGIDLIQAVKSKTPDTIVVMLSSFDDFRFVKDSLKLGAQDYLLKHDLEPESLLRMLGQVRERLERNRSAHERQEADRMEAESMFMKRIMLGELTNKDDIDRKAAERGFSMRESSYNVMLVVCMPEFDADIGDNEEHAKKRIDTGVEHWLLDQAGNVNALTVALSPGKYVILLSFRGGRNEKDIGDAAGELASGLLAAGNLIHRSLSVGINGISVELSELKMRLEQTEAALYQTAYEGWNRIYAVDKAKPAAIDLDPVYLHHWMSALKEGNLEAVESALEALFRHVRTIRLPKQAMRQLLFNVFALLGVQAEARNIRSAVPGDWHGTVIRALERVDSVERLHEQVLAYCRTVFETNRSKKVYRKEIQLAIALIDARYREDLSLAKLSHELNFSANYLSNLFRAETGMRVIEYLNRVRMDKAKQLLADPRLKVYEVAEKVGYQDTSYFCKVFKEVTGVTVSEFRKIG